MNVKIEQSWKDALGSEFDKDYFIKLTDFVRGEYLAGHAVYPAPANIFNAFNLCPLENVKVVIIGQDPYHEPGQAHGLCFSVLPPTPIPPSLVNIYKEIQNDAWRFNRLGKTGRVVVEFHTDGGGASCGIACGTRLGTIYRCGYTRCFWTVKYRLYAVGQLCPAQGGIC